MTIPLLLLGVVLSSAAISSLVYAGLWASLARLQLRLDRCVEATATELKEVQEGITSSNRRMQLARAAALAAALPTMGESLEAAKPVLAAEFALQEGYRVRWKVRQTQWILKKGCDGKRDRFFPLPNLNWFRPPPDSLGPRPLEWDRKGAPLRMTLWQKNRFARAKVFQNENEERWSAKWASE